MSLLAFLGALESGLIYALVALGVLISFRILDFPDLTADGSFPLGGAVSAVAIVAGFNPFLACAFGLIAGMVAGTTTAVLNVKLGILHLLAGILVMTALWSINLRVMGKPNTSLLGEPTIFSTLGIEALWVKLAVLALIVFAIKLLLDWFFATQIGLAMRATGANPKMAQAQGISTNHLIIIGMALSNGLIALAGAIFVQIQGFADVTLGVGTIVIGLVAVILGETLLSKNRLFWATLAVIVGSVVYKLFIQFALSNQFLRGLGVQSQDLNLITALLVTALLIVAHKKGIGSKK